jgi:type I site-specific restriction endonuclease
MTSPKKTLQKKASSATKKLTRKLASPAISSKTKKPINSKTAQCSTQTAVDKETHDIAESDGSQNDVMETDTNEAALGVWLPFPVWI